MSLLTALLLGSDSFAVSFGCGPLLPDRRSRLRLALAFAGCDALAVVVGASLPWRIGAWGRAPVPLVVAGSAVCLLLLSLGGRRMGRRPVFGLPVLVSFDNLVFGAGAGHLSLQLVGHAGLLGLATGVMALSGLAIGGAASRMTRAPAERWAGVCLLTAAFVMFAF